MAGLPRRRRREPEDLPELLSDDALIEWAREMNATPHRDWEEIEEAANAAHDSEPEPVVAVAPELVVEEPEPEPAVAMEPVAFAPESVMEPGPATEPDPALAWESELVALEPEPVAGWGPAVSVEPDPASVWEPESALTLEPEPRWDVEPEPAPAPLALDPMWESEREPAAAEQGPEPEPRWEPEPSWESEPRWEPEPEAVVAQRHEVARLVARRSAQLRARRAHIDDEGVPEALEPLGEADLSPDEAEQGPAPEAPATNGARRAPLVARGRRKAPPTAAASSTANGRLPRRTTPLHAGHAPLELPAHPVDEMREGLGEQPQPARPATQPRPEPSAVQRGPSTADRLRARLADIGDD